MVGLSSNQLAFQSASKPHLLTLIIFFYNRVNGCVGFANYKFFFLFVLYTAIFALWTLVTIVPEVVYGVEHHVSVGM